jgi:alpha-tubulin suppressor-like RCC1 family protein
MNTRWKILIALAWLLWAKPAHAGILQGPVVNPANGHTYYLLTENTWLNSQAEAQALGGNLVSVNDAAENTWLMTTFSPFFTTSFQLWIGLTDQTVEGQYQWISGEPATFANWGQGEPNNYVPDEDFAFMVGTSIYGLPPGTWVDSSSLPSPSTGSYCGVVEIQEPPIVVTGTASGITTVAATLRGTVNPGGLACTARFEYGLTTTYGNTVNVALAPNNGTSFQNVSAKISDLLDSTTYHYRMSATNALRANTGADRTFTTLSTHADLANLSLDSGTFFPSFSSAITEYTAIVSNASIIVRPTLADIKATLRVNGIMVNSGGASDKIPLAMGPNVIRTVVAAQDGITTKTYLLNVIRLSADLATLATSAGALAPPFNSAITEYSACVANTTTSITVMPAAVDATATVRVNGSLVNSGGNSGAIQLAVGSNTISIAVTGRDAITTHTYHLTVTRLSANAGLPSEVVAWGAGATRTNAEPEYGQAIVPAGLSGMTAALAAGVYHTVALKNDGTVAAWGSNTSGQTTVPGSLSGVTAIAAGAFHTLALKSNGSVVAWGAGKTAVTGSINRGQSVIPPGLTTLTASALIPDNTTGLIDTITLGTANAGIVAGMSVTGPGLSVGSAAKVVSVVGTTVTLSVPNLNTVFTPAQLTFSTNVVAIAAGYYHSVALKSDGTMVAWGDNTEGQTTLQGSPGEVVAIAAGNAHTVAMKNDGTIVAWGRNVEGQTALQSGLSGVAAIAAGGDFTMALQSDGRVVAWGDNANGQTSVPPAALSGVTAIAAGGDHALALKSDGTVVSWGMIWDGSTYLSEIVPAGLRGISAIAAGAFHTVAMGEAPLAITAQPASVTVKQGEPATFTVSATSTLPLSYQWRANGINLADDANISGTATASLVLANAQPAGLSNYSVVVTNAYGSVASTAATLTVSAVTPGAVVAWGAGTTSTGVEPEFGQSIIPAGLNGATRAVAGGGRHTVALKDDGMVVTWGDNSRGQTNTPGGLSGVTAIAAGAYHTLALKSDGSVVAWGDNTFGQRSVPSGLTTLSVSATIPANTTGLISTITLAAANAGIVPGMSVAGPGFTVGMGAQVLTVVGTTVTLSVPNVNTVLTPAPLTFSTGVVAIAAGYYHSVALKSNGTVVAWGDNTSGQVTGTPTTTAPNSATANPVAFLSGVTAIAAGDMHTVALIGDGTVVAWGRDREGQTAIPADLSGVTAIAAGVFHTVALRRDGTMVAWGSDRNGQVTGIPTTTPPFTATANPVPFLNGITAIAAGGEHTVAIKSDGTVVTWGKIGNGAEYVNDVVPAGLSEVTAIAAGAHHTVAIVAGPPIIITAQPSSRTNGIGTTATFTVMATGTEPRTYQWRKNGTNLGNSGSISGADTATLTLASVQATDASNYSVVLTDAYGSVVSTSATLTLTPAPLAAAVDSPGLVWNTGGDGPWQAQSTSVREGLDAARSGSITDGQESWLQTTLTGPGTLSFWWKVSSEDTWDVLEFYQDGTLQDGSISGTTEWLQRTLTLAAGTHVLKWRYAKDESTSGGQDAGWLDAVNFIQEAPLQPHIATQPVPRCNVAGTTASFTVTVMPGSPQSYQWFMNDMSLADGGNISGANTTTLTLANVQLIDRGSYSVVVANAYGSVTSTAASLTLAPPRVTTAAASDSSATSATLNGTLNPNGLASTARFEYGLTSAYGSKAHVALVPDNGLDERNVSISISGLQAGTTYHYRLTATNGGGTSTGEDLTFATPPAVPAISAAELVAPGMEISGGKVNFTVHPSVAGRHYQLQCSATLAGGTWQDLGPLWIGDGDKLVITMPYDPAAQRRFYRLALQCQGSP